MRMTWDLPGASTRLKALHPALAEPPYWTTDVRIDAGR